MLNNRTVFTSVYGSYVDDPIGAVWFLVRKIAKPSTCGLVCPQHPPVMLRWKSAQSCRTFETEVDRSIGFWLIATPGYDRFGETSMLIQLARPHPLTLFT